MAKRDLRILLTNDDGIHAPGFEVLEEIAATLSDDVWVVAPETEQSGASHSLTLHMPLRLRQLDDRRFALQGTPTDCVMMAVKYVQPKYAAERPFDLILSGVNRGSNIADDVTYSGTVAGAMEGTHLGVPSIAMSQVYAFVPGSTVDWRPARTFATGIIEQLLDHGWPENVFININFPGVACDEIEQVQVTRQGSRDQSTTVIEERVDARGEAYFWIGFKGKLSNPPEGTDLRAIYNGRISVTPLHLNLTEVSALDILQGALEDSPRRS